MTFNPQGAAEVERVLRKRNTKYMNDVRSTAIGRRYMALTNCPRSVLRYSKDSKGHSFAKPIALLEYLIRTFSNDNEVVLDHTMGSGSTGVAAYRTDRRFIGAENGFLKDGRSIFKIAESRINAELTGQDNTPPIPPKPRGGKPQKKRRAWSAEQRAKYEATLAHRRAATSASNDNAKYAVPSSVIHQGDCLEVMRDMPAKSVDMIFTSPPYNIAGSLKRNSTSGLWKGPALADGYASYSDDLPYPEYVEWQKECLTEMWRLLRDDGAIFYNHKPRVQKGVLQTPLDLNPGLPIRQIVIWNRKTGFNFSQSFYCPAHEWIVIFAKPGFRLRDRKASGAQDVWTIPHERNNKHPAPFPVELPQRAIETTTAQVILDPFAGSGTTGVAAKRLARSFIGIELDPGYCETARDRIAAEPFPLAA